MSLNTVNRFKGKTWLWAFFGSLILWVAMGVISSNFGFKGLLSNGTLACFLAIVSFGQMFAISLGDGAIDLSIPYVITLTAFLSMGLINGSDSNIWLGLLAALGVGVLVAILNTISITLFQIPPIIATMALGFIINTFIFLYAAKFRTFKASPFLSTITRESILGIPWIIIITLLLTVALGYFINQTAYGRALMAVGQNKGAAYFAGINVNWATLGTFLLSDCLAAIGGVLISAQVGGAFLDMGQPYMLQSVGVVVIGGTLVSGGKASVIGTLFGSLFMLLLVSLMSITHLPIGIQNIVEGIMIILILAVATPKTADRI